MLIIWLLLEFQSRFYFASSVLFYTIISQNKQEISELVALIDKIDDVDWLFFLGTNWCDTKCCKWYVFVQSGCFKLYTNTILKYSMSF